MHGEERRSLLARRAAPLASQPRIKEVDRSPSLPSPRAGDARGGCGGRGGRAERGASSSRLACLNHPQHACPGAPGDAINAGHLEAAPALVGQAVVVATHGLRLRRGEHISLQFMNNNEVAARFAFACLRCLAAQRGLNKRMEPSCSGKARAHRCYEIRRWNVVANAARPSKYVHPLSTEQQPWELIIRLVCWEEAGRAREAGTRRRCSLLTEQHFTPARARALLLLLREHCRGSGIFGDPQRLLQEAEWAAPHRRALVRQCLRT